MTSLNEYGDFYTTYPDKYNLDNFSNKPERKSSSGTRRARSNGSAPRSSSQSRTGSTARRQPQQAKRTTAKAAKKPSPQRQAKPAAPQKAAAPKKAAPKKSAPQRVAKPNKSGRYAATKDSKVYRAQKPPMKRGKKIAITFIVFIIVGAILTGAGIVGFNMYMDYKKNQPFRFSNGVKVSGIDIGRLSVDDAKKKLKKESMSIVRKFNLKVAAHDVNKTYTQKDFEYNFDYTSALKKAKVYSMKEQGIYESKSSKATESETEFTTMENPDFKLRYSVDDESIEDQVRKLALNVNRDPENAKVSEFHPFSSERFTYKRGKLGYTLDQNGLVSKINKFFKSGKKKASIQAEVETVEPAIAVADIQNNIVGLSTATSTSNNTAAGTHNMAVALKACNGSIIEPGALWSFNDCTGDSNDKKNGYKKATVISEKKLDQGIGGGICQASTTIFQAGAMANMDIVERHNHYWASGYAFAGEDATIDYPNLDLKMRNITDYQMFIECAVDGNTLVVNIYGYQDPSYDNVRLRSENYDITKGQFFRTRTYRTLYKNHEIVQDDVICTSYYSLTDNHTVRTVDEGTFRTSVGGYIAYETEPATEPPAESSESDESSAESGEDAVSDDTDDSDDSAEDAEE